MKHCKMSLKTAFELVGERLSHADLKVHFAHLLTVAQKDTELSRAFSFLSAVVQCDLAA